LKGEISLCKLYSAIKNNETIAVSLLALLLGTHAMEGKCGCDQVIMSASWKWHSQVEMLWSWRWLFSVTDGILVDCAYYVTVVHTVLLAIMKI